MRPLLMPATTYSPTHFRVQYDRPGGAKLLVIPDAKQIRPRSLRSRVGMTRVGGEARDGGRRTSGAEARVLGGDWRHG